jgi:sugar/nucleoside kinase (ribokinase family)
MYDFALYGHLTFDEVYHDGYHSTNIGGIANVWRALKSIDKHLNIYTCPLHIGESKIVIENDKKDNYSNLNRFELFLGEAVEAKLSHVAYVNELDSPSLVRALKGVKTADVCTTNENDGTPLALEIANEFDFLFVAEDQIHLIPKEFNRRLVVHGPTETTVFKASEQIAHYSNASQYLTGANVLGAGDYFAACYMYGIIHGRNDDHCAEMSQRLTTKYLKDRNEKA